MREGQPCYLPKHILLPLQEEAPRGRHWAKLFGDSHVTGADPGGNTNEAPEVHEAGDEEVAGEQASQDCAEDTVAEEADANDEAAEEAAAEDDAAEAPGAAA